VGRSDVIGMITRGGSFSGLAKYLCDREERVEWTLGRNIMTDDPQRAAVIMEATADQNCLIGKPVHHISISWAPEDRPSREQMEYVAGRVLDRLGLKDHEAVIVAHNDRAYAHLHIMVNRVHPETALAWSAWRDFGRVHTVMRELEQQMGFRLTPSSYRYREAGVEHREPDPTRGLSAGERRQLAHSDVEPLVSRVRGVAEELRMARGWSELNERAAAHGLTVERKHGGIVFTDGVTAVKASRIGRDLSMRKLEERFQERFPAVLPPPNIESLAADVRVLHAGEQLARASACAAEAADRARGTLATAERAAERVTLASRHLDSALTNAYGDPEAARRAYDALARERGFERANAILATAPEQFGALRYVEIKTAWGLRNEQDVSAARDGALQAARSGEELMRADRHARAAGSVESLRTAVVQADFAAANARTAMSDHAGRHGAAEELRRSVGLSVDRLLPSEMRQLQQLLSVPELGLAQLCRGKIRELFRSREGPAYS
jgi:hypothetical protein